MVGGQNVVAAREFDQRSGASEVDRVLRIISGAYEQRDEIVLNLQANIFKERDRYIIYRNVRAQIVPSGVKTVRRSLRFFALDEVVQPLHAHFRRRLLCFVLPTLAHIIFTPCGSTVSGGTQSKPTVKGVTRVCRSHLSRTERWRSPCVQQISSGL